MGTAAAGGSSTGQNAAAPYEGGVAYALDGEKVGDERGERRTRQHSPRTGGRAGGRGGGSADARVGGWAGGRAGKRAAWRVVGQAVQAGWRAPGRRPPGNDGWCGARPAQRSGAPARGGRSKHQRQQQPATATAAGGGRHRHGWRRGLALGRGGGGQRRGEPSSGPAVRASDWAPPRRSVARGGATPGRCPGHCPGGGRPTPPRGGAGGPPLRCEGCATEAAGGDRAPTSQPPAGEATDSTACGNATVQSQKFGAASRSG